MGEDLISGRQKVAFAVALGTGVVVGAAGVAVYQRLSQNVSLSVTRGDFSQEIATLTYSIDKLRQEIEELKGSGGSLPTLPLPQAQKPLKSAMKKTNHQSSDNETLDLELPIRRKSHSRTQSWGSSKTSSSTSTEYFSAVSDDDEDNEQDFSTPEGESGGSIDGGDALALFTKVDDLMEGSHDQQLLSLKLLEDNQAEYSLNPAFLGRLCKAQYLCSVLADQAGDRERKKELILLAVDSGAKALELDNENSEVHKWYAISLGSRGEFSGVKEKILDGFEFKSHIDTAARLAPRDYVTHHLLGRFCYEVSQLSWIERKMASTLFANPPEASLPEAIDHFLTAESLKPDGWKENRLFIAKCHIGLGDYVKAVTWLDKADAIPIASTDVREGIKDRISQEEIDKLLIKYEAYRF